MSSPAVATDAATEAEWLAGPVAAALEEAAVVLPGAVCRVAATAILRGASADRAETDELERALAGAGWSQAVAEGAGFRIRAGGELGRTGWLPPSSPREGAALLTPVLRDVRSRAPGSCALLLQRMGGRRRERGFYPNASGRLLTSNDYPFSYLRTDEGVVELIVGLSGDEAISRSAVRFCPRYPDLIPEQGSPELVLRNSQRTFLALRPEMQTSGSTIEMEIEEARRDKALNGLGGIVSIENQTVYPSVHRPGILVITMAGLRQGTPCALPLFLAAFVRALRVRLTPVVVVRFSVNLAEGPGDPPAEIVVEGVHALRGRAAESGHLDEPSSPKVDGATLLCRSHLVLGHGEWRSIEDLVLVDPTSFDPSRSREIAAEVAAVNARLLEAGRACVLVGPGRWASEDPWLGIPVRWSDIASAGVLIEFALPSFRIDPSRGMHFFRELVQGSLGYLHVGLSEAGDLIDWAHIRRLEVASAGPFVKHLRAPGLVVRLDVDRQRGVVLVSSSPAA